MSELLDCLVYVSPHNNIVYDQNLCNFFGIKYDISRFLWSNQDSFFHQVESYFVVRSLLWRPKGEVD